MAESENRMDFSPKVPSPAASTNQVPRYLLYGDQGGRPDWFVNVEPLDKRCRERGWIIEPHTHPRMTQLAFCATGGGTMTCEGDTFAFGPGCVMVAPPHRIHGFAYNEGGTGWVVTIQTLYLEDLLSRAPELRRVLDLPGVFPLAESGLIEVPLVMKRLEQELEGAEQSGVLGAEIQLMSLLLLFLRLWPAKEWHRPLLGTRADLVRRFQELVDQEYRTHPGLPNIALSLGVSVSQLRLACKTVAGISPIEIIHDRLIVEAKRCLIYTRMSIGQIADWLGFSDAAYFSRFFSRITGTAPSSFRKVNDGTL